MPVYLKLGIRQQACCLVARGQQSLSSRLHGSLPKRQAICRFAAPLWHNEVTAAHRGRQSARERPSPYRPTGEFSQRGLADRGQTEHLTGNHLSITAVWVPSAEGR